MRKSSAPAILASLALVVALAAQETPRQERISFSSGEPEASVEGQIKGYEAVDYLLEAGAGQTMTITLETSHGATYFNVFAPGTEPGRDRALFVGNTEGRRFQRELATTGDYLVQVYMMRSAARRNETASYTLSARIEGAANAFAKPPESGPWPVDIDASGELPCSTGSEALDLRCPFRVKRNPFGATLWVVKPGEERELSTLSFGDLRTLYFENDAFSTNDGSEMSWERDEDDWIVRAGDRERYRVPEAAIRRG